MFAWILKTNPENGSVTGSINPWSDILGSGDSVIFKKCSRKVSTPKVVNAEPKNTGDNSPLSTNSWSNGSLAPSNNSASSTNWSYNSSPISFLNSSLSKSYIFSAALFAPPTETAWNIEIFFVFLS